MSRRASLGFVLMCMAALPAQAARVKNKAATPEPEPETYLLSFADLALIRAPELTAAGFLNVVSQSIVQIYGMGSGAARGLAREGWDPIAQRCAVFAASCRDGCKPGSARLRYDAWLKLKPISTYKAPETPGDLPVDMGQESLQKYLKKQGYNSQKSKRFAQDFLQLSGNEQSTLAKFYEFISLDTKRDAYLGVDELMTFLDPATAEMAMLEFDTLARAEGADFARALGTDSAELVKGIMKTVNGVTVSKDEYAEKHLEKVIKEFIRRDSAGPQGHSDIKASRAADSFDGSLKFYQFAEVLPKITHDTSVDINGESVAIHVPTVEEVTGEDNRLELGVDDLEKWLLQQGIQNINALFGAFTGDKYKNAKKMAKNVVTWADGRKGEHRNARISTGSGNDEWADLAGRLAIYVYLDSDKDGKILFDEAYPFLLKHLQNPNEESTDGPRWKNPYEHLKEAMRQSREAVSSGAGQEEAKTSLGAALHGIKAVVQQAEELQSQLSA